MSSSLRLLKSRPWVATSALAGTGLIGAAYIMEYMTERGPTKPLPRHYDWTEINHYWSLRPVTTMTRFASILSELGPVAFMYVRDFVILKPSNKETAVALQIHHASALRDALTNLGPAFVKAGQQLSIRPDLVPTPVLKELQKLCDSVRPVSDEIAMDVIRKEFEISDVGEVFDDIKLVASASLGQVYKAKLRLSGDQVAVKVQRPNMRKSFSLDLFLLQKLGITVDAFTSTFTNQPPFHQALYESFASGSYGELDYCQEAAYQKRFKSELEARKCNITIPVVFDSQTTERVITTQWIDGIKLADSPQKKIRELIPVGVELFLTQLLDMGIFHADPHPGNLLVDKNGKLCLLDFGLCAEIDEKSRNAITKAIVHLLVRDFEALVSEDAIELGFLPRDFDTSELKPLLQKILTLTVVEGGSDLRKRKKKLMDVSNELNEIFFKYPFSVPPFFALVTRGLGLLEGIALTGDPDFDIFRASAPFAQRRAVSILGSHSF